MFQAPIEFFDAKKVHILCNLEYNNSFQDFTYGKQKKNAIMLNSSYVKKNVQMLVTYEF